MRMNGDRLELMLSHDGEPVDEILELMEALSRKRRYFRLRSGEFLDLSDLADWQETAAGIYEAAVRAIRFDPLLDAGSCPPGFQPAEEAPCFGR